MCNLPTSTERDCGLSRRILWKAGRKFLNKTSCNPINTGISVGGRVFGTNRIRQGMSHCAQAQCDMLHSSYENTKPDLGKWWPLQERTGSQASGDTLLLLPVQAKVPRCAPGIRKG
jgi:hypothetical protein